MCPSDFEKENAHIKQELQQGKSYATSFTPLHLPCIHAGKIHTQRQQQHWILLIRHSCCFLTTPSPSIIRCTGVLHQTDTEKWPISSALPLHSQPCHSGLSRSPPLSVGYYLIIASLTCQFSLQLSCPVISCSLFSGLHCSEYVAGLHEVLSPFLPQLFQVSIIPQPPLLLLTFFLSSK